MSYNLTTMQSIYHNQDEIVEITYNGSSVYQKSSGPDYTEPFYVENISNSTETLSIQKFNFNSPTLTIEYSTDNSNWNTFGTTDFDTPLTMSLNTGDKVYLRCTANVWDNNRINGVSKIGGNIMSLLYGSNFTGKETTFPTNNSYVFERLFQSMNGSNLNLVDASELLLPVDTLTPYCYEGMFCVCENLTALPELPATTLAEGCYQFLFAYCSSLTVSPELNATVLVDDCYSGLFDSCTRLREIKCLATTNVGYPATSGWTYSVAATGTFTKATGITWPTGISGIPNNWTIIVDEGLPAANELWYTSINNTLITTNPNSYAYDANNNGLQITFHGVEGNHCVIRYNGDVHHITENFIVNDSNLLTITFANYYKEIYSDFIKNCQNLTAINFGDNTNSQLYGIGDESFAGNTALTSIIIPPSLDKVWVGNSFRNCTALNYIEMRASHFDLTSWGDYFADFFANMGVAPGGTFKLYQDNEKYNMFVQQFTDYGWNIVNL